VVANVIPIEGDPLLGQSFLSRLPSWSIDNNSHVLNLATGEAVQTAPEPLPASAPPIAPPPAMLPPGGSLSTSSRYSRTNCGSIVDSRTGLEWFIGLMLTRPGRRPKPGLDTWMHVASNGPFQRSAIFDPSLIKSLWRALAISRQGDTGRLTSSRSFPRSGKAPGFGQMVSWSAAMLRLPISIRALRFVCPRVTFMGLLEPLQ
jgi:hypothetical protein